MSKYRKKPIVIEATMLMAYTEGLPPASYNDNRGGEVYRWLRKKGAVHNKDFWMDEEPSGRAFMVIKTLEGNMKVNIGDYIIQGVKGEFYPCKPDIFKMTYEKV